MVKNLPVNAGDMGSFPGLGRSPGEGNDNPLQYSCLGNSMVRGAWWAPVYEDAKESDNQPTVDSIEFILTLKLLEYKFVLNLKFKDVFLH